MATPLEQVAASQVEAPGALPFFMPTSPLDRFGFVPALLTGEVRRKGTENRTVPLRWLSFRKTR